MEKKRMKMEKIITEFFVIMILLIGVVQIELILVKIPKTAGELFAINDSIRFYNEYPRKTDAWTAEIEKLLELRREKYYNSDDFVVRTYSNANIVLKVLAIPVVLIFMLGAPFFALRHVLGCILERKRVKWLANKLKRERKDHQHTCQMLDEVI